jgi:hypothetical protein
VHVNRFVPIACEEEEPIRATPQDRRAHRDILAASTHGVPRDSANGSDLDDCSFESTSPRPALRLLGTMAPVTFLSFEDHPPAGRPATIGAMPPRAAQTRSRTSALDCNMEPRAALMSAANQLPVPASSTLQTTPLAGDPPATERNLSEVALRRVAEAGSHTEPGGHASADIPG